MQVDDYVDAIDAAKQSYFDRNPNSATVAHAHKFDRFREFVRTHRGSSVSLVALEKAGIQGDLRYMLRYV